MNFSDQHKTVSIFTIKMIQYEKWLNCFILMILLFCFSQLSAQGNSKISDKNLKSEEGFQFMDPEAKFIQIKFKTASNLIIIPVRINQSDTLNFILDTGVRYPIITELPDIHQLDLHNLSVFPVKGLGQDRDLEAFLSKGNTLSVDGLIAKNQDINVLLEDHFLLSTMLGIQINGLIGYDLFCNYISVINYDRKTIRLYKPEYYRKNIPDKWIVMPLVFDNRKPYIQTKIRKNKDDEYLVKLLLDTGASDALWLWDSSWMNPDKFKDSENLFLGCGLNGNVYGRKDRIAGLWLGDCFLEKPVVAVPNEKFSQIVAVNGRGGTIGAEILRRFVVTFDYPNRRLILKKTNRVKKEFHSDMSGIHISAPFPGFPFYFVGELRSGSPAAMAGIQINDQLLVVNHKDVGLLSVDDIYGIFSEYDGKKVVIKINRNGEMHKFSFHLKEHY